MLLRALGLKRGPDVAALKPKLPPLNAFVDLTVTQGGPKGSVCFEHAGKDGFAVSALSGMASGQIGVFAYQTPTGKFRFSARCTSVKGAHAHFAYPAKIDTLATFAAAQKRQTVRLDATVAGRWRLAHGGKGHGSFVRGTLSDISRTGCSLVIDRDLGRGQQVEVEVPIASAPLILLGEVMRAAKVAASGKTSLGLKFHGVRPEDDRAIMEFINKRQAERRSRGLA